MQRRDLLKLSLGTATAALLSQCTRQLFHTGSVSEVLSQTVSSDGGLLRLNLEARVESVLLGDRTANALTYNGLAPGPQLEVKPGDTVQIRLVNRLEQPTNLHFHGLHLPPQVDDVFREVPPGEFYTYEFQIPANHPAVTAWYHPHYHLNVADQVFGGLAGAFIVRGELDEIPEIQQAEEAVMVLQDCSPDSALTMPHTLAQKWGREGRALLVNGQAKPVVDLPQNGLLRLRLINASSSRIYRLELREHPWYLMATDRGAISEPTALERLILNPGERVELLLPGQQTPGDYQLWSLPYDRGISEVKASMGQQVENLVGVELEKEEVLATLRYRSTPRMEPLPLPQRLIPVQALPEPQVTREFVLDHGLDADAPGAGFIINGESFKMGQVNTHVRLGQTEDWRIINKASIDHPFHLHTNAFQVMERNGQPVTLKAWKDVVGIQGYESVTLRVRFEDFTGRTVYHCHILDHEDQGMMGVLEIS
ncbi:MAG: multicopper oxidase family protein [Cyanobacteria bacterium J06632_22]